MLPAAVLLSSACVPFGDAWIHFHGRVLDHEGAPIPNATVELHLDGGNPPPRGIAQSDAAGRYSFFVNSCPCRYTLEVVTSAVGYSTKRTNIPGRKANRLEQFDIILAREGQGPSFSKPMEREL